MLALVMRQIVKVELLQLIYEITFDHGVTFTFENQLILN
jgi:hypothetical protein